MAKMTKKIVRKGQEFSLSCQIWRKCLTQAKFYKWQTTTKAFYGPRGQKEFCCCRILHWTCIICKFSQGKSIAYRYGPWTITSAITPLWRSMRATAFSRTFPKVFCRSMLMTIIDSFLVGLTDRWRFASCLIEILLLVPSRVFVEIVLHYSLHCCCRNKPLLWL